MSLIGQTKLSLPQGNSQVEIELDPSFGLTEPRTLQAKTPWRAAWTTRSTIHVCSFHLQFRKKTSLIFKNLCIIYYYIYCYLTISLTHFTQPSSPKYKPFYSTITMVNNDDQPWSLNHYQPSLINHLVIISTIMINHYQRYLNHQYGCFAKQGYPCFIIHY